MTDAILYSFVLGKKLTINSILTKAQIDSLVRVAASEENSRAYRTHSKQLVAFAVLAVLYGYRTKWTPTENISVSTRLELRDVAKDLNLEKVAYETFAASLRRMVRKFCDKAPNDELFVKVRTAFTEHDALIAMLDLLAAKNIFTAGHMRTWAGNETLDPLDLERKERQRRETRDW